MKRKKDRYGGKNPSCNNKCRPCINNLEDINHIVAGYSQMSARYYLRLRPDEVAKTVLNSHLKNVCPDKLITLSSDPEYIYRKHLWLYWWNISIKTATKVTHIISQIGVYGIKKLNYAQKLNAAVLSTKMFVETSTKN